LNSSKHSLTVAIFDSGVGGLSVYQELRTVVPNVNYLYASDSENFPYGGKSKDQVTECVLAFLERLTQRYRIDVLVIACNTASTFALQVVRKQFPSMEVIGVVPAIKPAAMCSKTKKIGLLATPGTVGNSYTKDLIQEFCVGVEVISVGTRDLVNFSEAKLRGEQVDIIKVQEVLSPFFEGNEPTVVDHIVLGCTHFPWLKAELELAAKWPVVWIDSSAAIARRLQGILTNKSYNLESPMTSIDSQKAVFSGLDSWVEKLEPVLNKYGFDVSEL